MSLKEEIRCHLQTSLFNLKKALELESSSKSKHEAVMDLKWFCQALGFLMEKQGQCHYAEDEE